MKVEKIVLNEAREVSLTAYLLDTGGEFRNICKRPAVLILPGGGYQFCSEREADPVAMPYLKAGYQAFILRYSVGKHSVWPNPLQDYEQAMEMIRKRSEEWKVFSDKVAVIGFSAGGHLAAAAATTQTATSIRMTITVIVVLPIMMVYPFFQKYFVKGIMIGAVKG